MVFYLFSTLLCLNVISSILYLLFKGLVFVAKNRVNERFCYISCIAIMIMFLIPFYQLVPLIKLIKINILPATGNSLQFGTAISEKNLSEIIGLTDRAEKSGLSSFFLSSTSQQKILFVWCIGVFILTLWYLITFMCFRWQLSQKHTKPISGELCETANCCALECGVFKQSVLRVSSKVNSPMMIGFFKPIIAVPVEQPDVDNVSMILKHEFVHYRRHDLWWKMLGTVLKIIYWFNPIVWLLCRDLDFYMETSCDAEVVRNLSYDERKQYGYLLISYIQLSKKIRSVQGISFISPKRTMKRRIVIMLNGKKSQKIITTAIVCVLAASSFALSAFAAETSDKLQNIDGVVYTKDVYNDSNNASFSGEVQKNIPFAQKIELDDIWDIEVKYNENSKNFDPAQNNFPPLNIPSEFKEAVMRGEVKPMEVGEGVTIYPAK